MPKAPTTLIAAAATLTLFVAAARGEDASTTADDLKQNFVAEHEIGRRFHVDSADLPPPKTGSIVTNRSLTLPYEGQVPLVPPGFTATPFATGLVNPRRLLVLPNGDVLVTEQSAGYLTLLRDDGEGRAKWINRHVEDLNKPYGLAWRDGYVLVADQDGIWQVPHQLGALRAGRSQQQSVAQVPPKDRQAVPGAYGAQMITKKGVFGIVQGHQNRHLAIDPRTGALFVGVGSSGNLGVEPEPKATIQRFEADGSNQTTYASGTRNPTALAFHPQTPFRAGRPRRSAECLPARRRHRSSDANGSIPRRADRTSTGCRPPASTWRWCAYHAAAAPTPAKAALRETQS